MMEDCTNSWNIYFISHYLQYIYNIPILNATCATLFQFHAGAILCGYLGFDIL